MPHLPSQIRKRERLIQEYETVKNHINYQLSPSERAGAILSGAETLPPDYLCEFDYWYDVKILVVEVTREVSEKEVLEEEEANKARAKIQADRFDKIKATLNRNGTALPGVTAKRSRG